MELEHGDTPVVGLLDRPPEVLQRPARPGVAGRGDEQGVVAAGLEGEAAPFLVGVLRQPPAPGELYPQVVQDGQRPHVDPVAGVSEAGRHRDAMLTAANADAADLPRQVAEGVFRDGPVVEGVVADLEAVPVELGDLLPGHVVPLVVAEVKPLGDEEGRAEAQPLQQRPRHREMRLRGIVERQHHEPIRDRLQGPRRRYRPREADEQ
jgi:hypothetical protein